MIISFSKFRVGAPFHCKCDRPIFITLNDKLIVKVIDSVVGVLLIKSAARSCPIPLPLHTIAVQVGAAEHIAMYYTIRTVYGKLQKQSAITRNGLDQMDIIRQIGECTGAVLIGDLLGLFRHQTVLFEHQLIHRFLGKPAAVQPHLPRLSQYTDT